LQTRRELVRRGGQIGGGEVEFNQDLKRQANSLSRGAAQGRAGFGGKVAGGVRWVAREGRVVVGFGGKVAGGVSKLAPPCVGCKGGRRRRRRREV